MLYTCFLDTSIGCISITANESAVTNIDFSPILRGSNQKNTVLELASLQLAEYFAGIRTRFDVPVMLNATPFRICVWNALLNIPYGETRSYGDIARTVGNPHAARAVGGANHANPIPIIIPCHRVISFDGSLGGFGGGLETKRALLKLEGVILK